MNIRERLRRDDPEAADLIEDLCGALEDIARLARPQSYAAEARTCAIGALTDMAVPPSDTELVEWRLSPAGRAALKGGE